MKVGILGTGAVARAHGLGFTSGGHDVTIGTRDPGGDAKQTVTDILLLHQ